MFPPKGNHEKNVGIGTTTANEKLNVSGNVAIGGTITAGKGIAAQRTGMAEGAKISLT